MIYFISQVWFRNCQQSGIDKRFSTLSHRYYLFILMIICSGLLKYISSNTLFEDNLKSELSSRLHWLCTSPAESSMVFTNNGVFLTNTHTINSLIALHSFSKKPETFSVAVNIDTRDAGPGIFFNITRDNLGRFNGYAAVLSYGKAELIKFNQGTITTIASHASPFVKNSRNRLEISKSTESIQIFCNGYFLFTVYEHELPPGDCALMVQPLSRVLFSEFKVTAQAGDSLTFPEFIDNFNDMSGFGWGKNGNGVIGIKDSSLNITTGNYQNCRYGLEFPLRNFSLTSSIKLEDGNDSNFYGIYFSPNQLHGLQTHGSISFGLNRKGICRILDERDSLILFLQYSGSLLCKDTTMFNTLRILQHNNKISWYLNNTIIHESSGIGVGRGAGVFSSQGLNVLFDNFKLTCNGSDQETSIANNNQYRYVTHYSTNTNTTNIQIDLLGRKYPAIRNSWNKIRSSAAMVRILERQSEISVK